MSNPVRGTRWVLALALIWAVLAGGCNSAFDIHEGQPRAQCSDPLGLLIDDMEDGVADICPLSGRHGAWYTVGDGTSADLTVGSMLDYKPTLIPGGRGASRYAARFTGSGFTDWGALLGFNLNAVGLAVQPYDASNTGGIKFWMKSNAAVSVNFLIPETVLPANGGQCDPNANDPNCNSHFAFKIAAPSADWAEYEVPFSALTQQYEGKATWNPQLLLGIQFLVGPGAAFDVWIDDVSFYYCATPSCVPTCTDPALAVACPSGNSNGTAYPAACRPTGTDCAAVKTWCVGPSLIDDMEDGDSAICASGGRDGVWFSGGDGTSTDLSPSGTFVQTLIPGGRGTSHYAARLSGSGFTHWGALMGFKLNGQNQPYDASRRGGIKFWMKSDVPVFVAFPIPETIPVAVGTCVDDATEWNCGNNFGISISAPSADDWVEYQIPFTALGQVRNLDADYNQLVGSATWDPSRIVQITFASESGSQGASPGRTFETWVDDVQFYFCAGPACIPTCSDPNFPVACPASAAGPAHCWIDGTDCSQLLYASLLSVWGSGPDDVWAVGVSYVHGAGVIRHWDGSVWSPVSSDTTAALWSVSGSGPKDAWAIADHGSIVRWNGSAWHTSNTGTQSSMSALWGSGPNDIWVADPSTLRHWDGSAWSASSSGVSQVLWSLWGSSPSDVWAAGGGGALVHWNGSAWSPVASGTNATFQSVWGSAAGDVWAVGDAGTILHWDGSTWSPAVSGTDAILSKVWGSGPSDVWAVGLSGTIIHWDGSAWTLVPPPSGRPAFFSVWGSGPSDVWAVGSSGTIIHWDGHAWAVVPNGGTP